MSKLFLGPSGENDTAATIIQEPLAKMGWDDVFFDLHPQCGSKAGERWQEALKRAPSACEVVTCDFIALG